MTDQENALVCDVQPVGSGREEILVEAMEVIEAMLTLTSAPALVGRPESKSVAGRRACNRREAWGRLGMAMSTRGSMASPAAEAMKRRIAPMAARRDVRTKRGPKNGMSGRGTTNSGTANPAVESI